MKKQTSGETDAQNYDYPKIVDLSLMQEALHNDRELLQKLIDHFIKTVPQQLQMLKEAIISKNAVKIHEIAHMLKGILSNFGAHKATELAAKLVADTANERLADAETIYNELNEEINRVSLALKDAQTDNQ